MSGQSSSRPDVYRKTLELDRDSDYTYVDLGGVVYPFPTPEAAERFATAERSRRPGVTITVR
ncbi:hypothetical protein KIV65_gp28 [Mycobacterium phage Anthony]|uniref:Uncharacterized protein n=1 Tax=Mycobacterium phage Anthony TaxID=2599857 RepID=A0A5J6TKV8_9CAUD|nr:hypothetical protein KIV65_gp28 [Mycobacterium phage Anthony]QFG10439.1 hypothetical protein PBI_ANTHONY_69 [Mycobacterium phage Anthony]